jgi:hypothetical protein
MRGSLHCAVHGETVNRSVEMTWLQGGEGAVKVVFSIGGKVFESYLDVEISYVVGVRRRDDG